MKPSDQPNEEASGNGPNVAAQPPGRVFTVLVVEDDELVREVASLVLNQQGYVTLKAADADEAVQAVKDRPEGSIDLLLTDCHMPSMSGMELATLFRERHPGVKVLYMSGYQQDEVFENKDLGALEGFVQKPFTPNGLAEKVKGMLDHRPPRSE